VVRGFDYEEKDTEMAKKRTVRPKTTSRKLPASKAAGKRAEFHHIPWHTVDLEDLNPLLQRQFVVGQNVMLARVLLKKGCVVPEHSHHNEQITFIAEGALKFWIDGEEIVVRAGEVLLIPPHMPHKAEAVVDTVDFDVFCPPRADWINKTDKYLRGGK
jgi:quercetin dioxygenase-like cupin family protein